ncbi:hypothetical protein BC829DRAFT_423400 [Chytridium lagenaria]|nr:hypothetical protein BC829DRAFT_423400 [Chytridium lagenaria]
MAKIGVIRLQPEPFNAFERKIVVGFDLGIYPQHLLIIQPTQLNYIVDMQTGTCLGNIKNHVPRAIEEGIAKVIGRMVEDVGQFAGEDANWTEARRVQTRNRLLLIFTPRMVRRFGNIHLLHPLSNFLWDGFGMDERETFRRRPLFRLLHYAIARLPDDFMAPANWVTPEAVRANTPPWFTWNQNRRTQTRQEDEEEDAEANQSRNKAIHLTPQRTSTGPPSIKFDWKSIHATIIKPRAHRSAGFHPWRLEFEPERRSTSIMSLNPANARRAISDMFALMPYTDEELGNMVDAVQPAELRDGRRGCKQIRDHGQSFHRGGGNFPIEKLLVLTDGYSLQLAVFHRTNDLPFPLNKLLVLIRVRPYTDVPAVYVLTEPVLICKQVRAMYGLIEVVKAYTAVTAVYGLIFTGTKISGRVRPYPAVVVNPHTAATVVYGLTFTGINMLQRSGRVRPYPASGPTQIAKHLGVYGPIWPLSTINYTAVYGPLVRI